MGDVVIFVFQLALTVLLRSSSYSDSHQFGVRLSFRKMSLKYFDDIPSLILSPDRPALGIEVLCPHISVG